MRAFSLALLAVTLLGCCEENGPPGPIDNGGGSTPPVTARTSHDCREDCPGHLPPVGDQGDTESCVGWSAGYGATTFLLKKYRRKDWDPGHTAHRLSAAYLYNLTLQHQVGCESGTKVTASDDVQMSTALALLAQHGISSEHEMPVTADFARRPTKKALDEAATLLPDEAEVTSWERCDVAVPMEWAPLKERIAQVGPALFLVEAWSDFGCGVGADYVPDPYTRTYRADHWLLCIGFDDNHVRESDQQTVPSFLFQNSWGTGWGRDGYVWIPYEVLVPSDGIPRLLVEVYLPKGPPAAPVDTNVCFPQDWLDDPSEERGEPEKLQSCAGAQLAGGPDLEQEVSLPPAENSIVVSGPRVPLSGDLVGGIVKFIDTTHGPFYSLGTPAAERGHVGAFVPTVTVTVTDKTAAPARIVLRSEVSRFHGKVYARKKITIHVR